MKRFIVVLTLAIAFTAGVSASWADRAEELVNQVEIRRTAYGVPHIKADNTEALGFGFGYCQAEDHLPNIMRSLLRARGELGRTFGGKSNLESDFWNRQFRVRARAIETYHRLDADFRKLIEGFAEGLNHYMKLHPESTPEWAIHVTAHDIAAHGMTGVMRFAFDRGRITRRFLAAQQQETAAALAPYSPDQDMMGSNMWAFSPDRTKSGNAILLGNPHQSWSEVATYYEAHLTVPGVIDFYGSTFVGRPVLTTGFNKDLGWTHTVNYPDLEEIYELALDPAREDHYLFDGGSIPLTSETVAIEFKDSEGDDELKSETRTFWHSPLGPVIHRTDTHVFVLRSAAYDEFRFYQQWFRLGQAADYEEFREALDIRAIPMFNITYADRVGNIYYLWNGTVPKLPHEAHRAEPVAASGSDDVWTEFHSISELPQLKNPKGGYVMNSNDPPYFTNLNEPMDPADFPDYFPDHRLGLRSQHSLSLIHNDTKFSLEDVRDMKFSLRMLLADRVKDDLIGALRASNPDATLEAAIKVLENWDNSMAADSVGSVVFEIWWNKYRAGEGRTSAPDAYAVPWSPDAPVTTPSGLGNKDRAVESFLWALEETKKLHGAWDASWGDVHRLRNGDYDLPISGGSGRIGAFRVLGFRTADDGKLVANTGDSCVMAVEFAETPRAYTVLAYSESGNPDSPHFADQSELFANNQMKRAAFTEEEIAEQLIKSYRPGKE